MDLPAPAPPSQPLTSLQTSVAASQHGAALCDRGTRLSTVTVISLASYFMDSIWNIFLTQTKVHTYHHMT